MKIHVVFRSSSHVSKNIDELIKSSKKKVQQYCN